MLILTRKLGEKVIIANQIEITLLEIRGRQARLGIQAPPDIVINREEVQKKIDQLKHASE